MSPRFVLILSVAAVVALGVIRWQGGQWNFFAGMFVPVAVGGLLLGAFVGMICGWRSQQRLRGIRPGSFGGFFGGIFGQVVFVTIYAVLPKHRVDLVSWVDHYSTMVPTIPEDLVWLVNWLLFLGCTGYVAWIRAKRTLLLPKTSAVETSANFTTDSGHVKLPRQLSDTP